jgi:hypothetical protein
MDGAPHIIAEPFDRRDARLTISRLGNRATLADLQGKNGYLMISVKNSNFNTRLVNAFCDLVETHLGAGEVILVDTPYAATIMATEMDEARRSRELENLYRLAGQRRRFVERILTGRGIIMPMRSFDEVEREVAPALRHEVSCAFEADGGFRKALLQRAREVIPYTIPDALIPRFAQFLVCEIPVLCHLYYARGMPGVVDVYPGENPQLFWDIERGRFADELPGISKLAEGSPGLIYVDICLSARQLSAEPELTRLCRSR